MDQTVKRKRFGGRRIRCMPEGLREKLNKLLIFGFSPIETKRILACLYSSKVSITTLKKQRKLLYRLTQENNKDFKFRYKQLSHGKVEWIPSHWLQYYEEPSNLPTETSTVREKRVVEKEVPPAEVEAEYNKKRVKTLIGKPF